MSANDGSTEEFDLEGEYTGGDSPLTSHADASYSGAINYR